MEKIKNVKKDLIVILVACVVFFIIGIITGYMTANTQENRLRKEIDKISKMDLLTEEINMEIKTKDEYAVIEQTIKEYLNKYSTTLKEVYEVLNTDKFEKILTAENYKNDGPEFIETKNFISESRTKFNEGLDTLIDMSSKETMEKAIEDKNLEQKYIDLYNELMIGNEDFEKDLNEAISSFEESKELINKLLDTQEKIIDFLINNKEQWSINENNEIAFNNAKLVNEYNSYLEEI